MDLIVIVLDHILAVPGNERTLCVFFVLFPDEGNIETTWVIWATPYIDLFKQ